MRTGLSRRKGGRCCGSRVYSLFGTAENWTGLAIPGRETTTGTLPTSVVLEKDRFGGEDRGAVGTDAIELGIAGFTGRFAEDWSLPATVSWRSCAHCPLLTSGLDDLRIDISNS